MHNKCECLILSELSVGIDISANLSLVRYHFSCLNLADSCLNLADSANLADSEILYFDILQPNVNPLPSCFPIYS